MKIKSLIVVSSLFILTLGSCKKAPYVDELLYEEWIVQGYYDLDQNLIHEKPEGLPKDIVLVLRKDDNRLSGFVITFAIDGSFDYDKENNFSMDISFPKVVPCCEWDELFLETWQEVESYECDGNILKLYYNQGENYIAFIN